MPLSQEELREALLIHSELEDMQRRLEVIQAMPVASMWSAVKNAVSQASSAMNNVSHAVVHAVKAGKDAYHAKKNQLPTAQEISNYLHTKFKVTIAQDLQGNIHADVNGVRVEVTVSADKSTWQVTINGATSPVTSLEDMGNYIDAHTRATVGPAASAKYQDFLRHSQTIMRCKPVA